MRLYALHDFDTSLKNRGAFPVSQIQARRYNADGYGIFHTPNRFSGRRSRDNCAAIDFWFTEIDAGTKADQRERILAATLLPTQVVESAKGYHCYWGVEGTASISRWKDIVRWGLVPALGGDPKASDVCRILRAPGYLHQKRPLHPFLVRRAGFGSGQHYTEEQMLDAFPSQEPTRTPRPRTALATFWGRVSDLDGREAIRRLSGHWSVGQERFELQECNNGNANIIRVEPSGTRYSTGSFVDRDGKFGCVVGGPTVAAWIEWYWKDNYKTAAKAIAEVFPEVNDE